MVPFAVCCTLWYVRHIFLDLFDVVKHPDGRATAPLIVEAVTDNDTSNPSELSFYDGDFIAVYEIRYGWVYFSVQSSRLTLA